MNVTVYAKFGIERELENKLCYKECINDDGYLHFHSQVELCIVDEGEMEIILNEKRQKLRAGEMSVSLSYDSHLYIPVNYSKSTVIVIPLYMCSQFVKEIKNKRPVNPFITDVQKVKEIKDNYNKLKASPNDILKTGYINIILGLVMECLSFEKVSQDVDAMLSSKILFYIHENFMHDISLKTISRELGYSESYISRYFKNCFNIGFNRYLNIIRLRNAIVLLRGQNNSITYCAIESGFNSLRTFYRLFSDEFGYTPREYCQKLLSDKIQ